MCVYGNEDMVGMRMTMRQICTSLSSYSSSYPIEKIGNSHTHTQSLREFPVKTGTCSNNIYKAGLFPIPN